MLTFPLLIVAREATPATPERGTLEPETRKEARGAPEGRSEKACALLVEDEEDDLETATTRPLPLDRLRY